MICISDLHVLFTAIAAAAKSTLNMDDGTSIVEERAIVSLRRSKSLFISSLNDGDCTRNDCVHETRETSRTDTSVSDDAVRSRIFCQKTGMRLTIPPVCIKSFSANAEGMATYKGNQLLFRSSLLSSTDDLIKEKEVNNDMTTMVSFENQELITHEKLDTLLHSVRSAKRRRKPKQWRAAAILPGDFCFERTFE